MGRSLCALGLAVFVTFGLVRGAANLADPSAPTPTATKNRVHFSAR